MALRRVGATSASVSGQLPGDRASSLGNRDRAYSLGTLEPGPGQIRQPSSHHPHFPQAASSPAPLPDRGLQPSRGTISLPGGVGPASPARHTQQPNANQPMQNTSFPRDGPSLTRSPEAAQGGQAPGSCPPAPAAPPWPCPQHCIRQLPAGLAPDPVTVSATLLTTQGWAPCSRHSRTAQGQAWGWPAQLMKWGDPGSAPGALPRIPCLPVTDTQAEGEGEGSAGMNVLNPQKNQGSSPHPPPRDPARGEAGSRALGEPQRPGAEAPAPPRPWVPGVLVLALVWSGTGSSGRVGLHTG